MELFGNLSISLQAILIALLTFVVYKLKKNQDYFLKRKVPFLQSHLLWGSMKDINTGKTSMYEGYKELCEQKNVKDSPFFGFFMPFNKPALMVQDPELIKKITVKDFNSFSDRHIHSHKGDPLGFYNMFTAKGSFWKQIRSKLSPFFTSGKLKMMFYLLDKTFDELIAKIDSHLENDSTKVKVKDILHLCTTDIIARCAFGVEAKSLDNPNGEFVKAAKEMIKLTFKRKLEMSAFFFFPFVSKYLNLKLFSTYTTEFVLKVIKQVMEEREKSGIKAHDLIDTLIELKNSNEFESIEVLIAQAMVFFSAGHETTSTSMTMAVYEITMHRNVHDRLRGEIKETLKKTQGVLNYDSLHSSEMPYLHQVVMEALRKYPAVPFLERMCIDPKGYSLKPESDFVIPFGMPIHIPVYSMFRSEKFFTNPLVFDPERFADNLGNPYEFMPFGTGPRNCVAERFGLMAMKMGIVRILMNFKLEQLPETPKDIIQLPNSMVIQSKIPIIAKFVKDPLFQSYQ